MDEATLEPPASPDQSEPQKPVAPTTYLFADLTPENKEERIKWLEQRCVQRIADCRSELGIQYGISTPIRDTWAWNRYIATAHYNGNFEDRKGKGTVFDENNWSMNSLQHVSNMTAAQVVGDLLSTDPFVAVMPEKPGPDEKLAKQVEAKVQRGISESNIQASFAESVRIAIACGERAVKLSYEIDETAFFGPATVAVDQAGTPIKTESGQYIFPKDNWIPSPTVQGQVILEKDPSYVDALKPIQGNGVVALVSTLRYVPVDRLPQTITHFKGLKAYGMNYADFLFPRDIPHLSKADFMAHVYDENIESLKREYAYIPDIDKVAESGSMSGQSQPNREMGEHEMTLRDKGMVNLHECYIRCDADQDGKEEWIFALMDYRAQRIFHAEYLGNMKMKRPPFGFIRGIESVPNRPYGNGVYTIARDTELFIDVTFNRSALKSSKKGSLTFVHGDGIVELIDGKRLVIGGKEYYTIPPTSPYSATNPPAFRVNLNELDDKQLELMEKAQQALVLRFGVVSAADGSASDLNASDTKYGIQNIERTGNLIMRMTENMIAQDITELLELGTDLLLEKMDENEPVVVPNEDALATLNRDEIRGLNRNVRLLMTKMRSADAVAVNSAIEAVYDRWFKYPLAERKLVRTALINILRGYEVQDADEQLKEPTDEELAAEQQAIADAQAAAQQRPPSIAESLQIKYSDLPPKAKLDALLQMGFRNLTIEDMKDEPVQPPSQDSAKPEPSTETPNAQ